MAKVGKKAVLGDYACELEEFPALDKALAVFQKPAFRQLPAHRRWEAVCGHLLQLLERAPRRSFLLRALVSYCDRVNRLQLTQEPLHITLFEFWLNQFSGRSEAENRAFRSKIAGKHIPRDDYGILFPLGNGKSYPGSHFVTAHLSPDVDTTIASFWGWLDAFAARIAEGQHIWNLPGGAPEGQATDLFQGLFGMAVFSCLPRVSSSISLSAMDLLTQTNIVKVQGATLTSALDHGSDRSAILYVNREGYYSGDWRGTNFEPVKQITNLLDRFLHWFENQVHVQVVSLFAKEKVTRRDIAPLEKQLFETPLSQSEPARELTEKQQQLLHALFQNIFLLPKGLRSTYGEFLKKLNKRSLSSIRAFTKFFQGLGTSELFTSTGQLREKRPLIFKHLQQIIQHLDHAIRNEVDRLDVVMRIKHEVLGYSPHYATLHSDVEELQFKIQHRDYLTIVLPNNEKQLYPIGIVPSSTLRKPILGTVSQRDFSNREEMRMASYLQIISVIDHHKTALETRSAPQAVVSDVQSSNVLVAELAFAINDRYSTGGMTRGAIEEQMHALSSEDQTRKSTRLVQALIKKQIAAEQTEYSIHPDREFTEYLCFLHAILDDTDLLSKVTKRDVACVVSLLNRMKSLTLRQETEIIDFDDLEQDEHFAQNAAKRILRNGDLYSIYGKIYANKEAEVEAQLTKAAHGEVKMLLSDTKEQNGCCRVGQIKLFASTIPHFKRIAKNLLMKWAMIAKEIFETHSEIDLHLQMISTIASADEVYHGKSANYSHADELWFWVPPTQAALDHLASFLSGFQSLPELLHNELSVEFRGPSTQKMEEIFARNFLALSRKTTLARPKDPSVAILRYRAGTLNSRKALVSPYLPHLPT
jgi:hypothetical protein